MTPDPQTIQAQAAPLCRALCALLEYHERETGQARICIPTAYLLANLRKHGGEAVSAPGFPVNAQRLGMALSAQKSALQQAGIIAAYKRNHKFGRLWMIGRATEFESEAALLDAFAWVWQRDPKPKYW